MLVPPNPTSLDQKCTLLRSGGQNVTYLLGLHRQVGEIASNTALAVLKCHRSEESDGNRVAELLGRGCVHYVEVAF